MTRIQNLTENGHFSIGNKSWNLNNLIFQLFGASLKLCFIYNLIREVLNFSIHTILRSQLPHTLHLCTTTIIITCLETIVIIIIINVAIIVDQVLHEALAQSTLDCSFTLNQWRKLVVIPYQYKALRF